MTRTARNPTLGAFAPAWMRGEADARALLPGGFDRRDERVAAVQRAVSRRCAPALVHALAAQHRELPVSDARQSNLDALAGGETAVVVSGQQVGLFTGPAFTLYKAAGVVAAARRLSEESGKRCVPLFWLQTEDHDWPEIDHCFVHGTGGQAQRISVPESDVPSRVSVASRRYDAGIETALAGLLGGLGAHPHAGEVVALLQRHYRRGASPAAAFRGVLAELFADDGLLFLDPRAPEVAELARPILEHSLVEADSISELLQRRSDDIERAGLAVQVPVRRGAPLCFFHPDAATGPRYRLEPRRGPSHGGPSPHPVWRLCDTDREVSRDEVLDVLGDDPLRFSSSALLRPLVQDALLPTAMYLGGPGEIGYFAQLTPLYETLGVAMPLIAPRPSFCVTGAGDRRRLESLGIGFADVGGDRDALLARLAGRDGEESCEIVEASLRAGLSFAFDEFAAKALAVDSNLARPIDKARAAVEHSMCRLAEKYRHSAINRDAVLVERVERVRAALAPEGVPQERVYGFASLAAEHSVVDLLTAVRRAIEPFEGRTIEIAL